MKVLIYIARHPLPEERVAVLKARFGEDFRVYLSSIRSVDGIAAVLGRQIQRLKAEGDTVVGVEVEAQYLEVLREILDANLGIPLILAQFEDAARTQFSHYLEVADIILVAKPLG